MSRSVPCRIQLHPDSAAIQLRAGTLLLAAVTSDTVSALFNIIKSYVLIVRN